MDSIPRTTLSIKYYGDQHHTREFLPIDIHVTGLRTQVSAVSPGDAPPRVTRILEDGYLRWLLPTPEVDPTTRVQRTRQVEQISVPTEKANAISLSAHVFFGRVVAEIDLSNEELLSLNYGFSRTVPVLIKAHEPLLADKHYVILLKNLGNNSFSGEFVEKTQFDRIEQKAEKAAFLMFALLTALALRNENETP